MSVCPLPSRELPRKATNPLGGDFPPSISSRLASSGTPLDRRGFTLVELLVIISILALLAVLISSASLKLLRSSQGTDALAKIRQMGQSVLQYSSDHNGRLPPLFPGQILYHEEGRGGRIVTECADYLGIEPGKSDFLVVQLMPSAYARLKVPQNQQEMRVFVMNTTINNGATTAFPFGKITSGGQPPVHPLPLATLSGLTEDQRWMMQTADQELAVVAGKFWASQTPSTPPLGNRRARFRFDGGAEVTPAP